MDTSKKGSLHSSEFKTCLLAIGIRQTREEIDSFFRTVGKDFMLPNGGIMYRNFLTAVDSGELPGGGGDGGGGGSSGGDVPIVAVPTAPKSPTTALKASQKEDDLLFYYAGKDKINRSIPDVEEKADEVGSKKKKTAAPRVGTAVYIPAPLYVAPIDGPQLSEEVGGFEDKVQELEKSLQATNLELQRTLTAQADTQKKLDQVDAFGVVTAGDMTDEIDDKTQQIASFATEISNLTESLNGLEGEKARLVVETETKRGILQKNAVKRADKDQAIKQLKRATSENEAQLGELRAVYDELVAEIAAVDAKTAVANGHVDTLLSPAQPPQSMTVRGGSNSTSSNNSNNNNNNATNDSNGKQQEQQRWRRGRSKLKSSLSAEAAERVKRRNSAAAQQHQDNLRSGHIQT